MLEMKELIEWLKGQAAELAIDGVEAEVTESDSLGDNPSARLEASSDEMMGRITAWVSGEFNFEVLRIADETQLLDVYIRTSSLTDVEAAGKEFQSALKDSSIAPRKYNNDYST